MTAPAEEAATTMSPMDEMEPAETTAPAPVDEALPAEDTEEMTPADPASPSPHDPDCADRHGTAYADATARFTTARFDAGSDACTVR